MMKRLVMMFLTALFSTVLWSQSLYSEAFLKKMNLDDAKVAAVLALEQDFNELKHESQVEQNFYKAQLERMLLKDDPNMDQVEQVLRDSMEWKLKETLAEIENRIKIRKIVGEETWSKMLRMAAEIRQRNAEQRTE
jgi:hypothetical protein